MRAREFAIREAGVGTIGTVGAPPLGSMQNLGKDIVRHLTGKNDQRDSTSPEDLTKVQKQIQSAKPDIPADQLADLMTQYKSGKVDANGDPVQQNQTAQKTQTATLGTATPGAIPPKVGQAMQAASPKPGTTLNNPKLGTMKVLPQEPGTPDSQKGIKVQPLQAPGLPPMTLKFKDLLGDPDIRKDLS